jgi:hypothetical protein
MAILAGRLLLRRRPPAQVHSHGGALNALVAGVKLWCPFRPPPATHARLRLNISST